MGVDVCCLSDVIAEIDDKAWIKGFESVQCKVQNTTEDTCALLRHRFISGIIKLCFLGFEHLNKSEYADLVQYSKMLDLQVLVKSLERAEVKLCTVTSTYPSITVEWHNGGSTSFAFHNVTHSMYSIPVGGNAEVVLNTKGGTERITYCRRIGNIVVPRTSS